MALTNALLGLISALITIVGFFVKKEINNFAKRIDRHDEMLFKLAGDVQRLIGYYYAGSDRRTRSREQ